MNFLRPSFLVLAALLALTGCDGKKERSRDDAKRSSSESRAALDAELARLMTGFGQVVKGVHDQSSWATAKPRVEKILAEIPAITDRLRELPEVPVAQYKYYAQRTKKREDALEETLGDRNTFLANLPDDVAAELLDLAGRFYNVMGDAQNALCGPPPPVPARP